MDLLEYTMELDILTLLGSGKYDAFYDRMRYLIRRKNGIAYIFSHYFEKIKVGS